VRLPQVGPSQFDDLIAASVAIARIQSAYAIGVLRKCPEMDLKTPEGTH
jgi:hypothetical protein